MAMEAINGVTELGHQINDLGQIQPQFPMENAIYAQPLRPEHFDLGVKPGTKISGGLNAQFIDDDGVDFFAGELIPGEVPDLNDEVHLIAAIESQLQDLMYLERDVRGTGGMCKQFALEAQKHIPNFGGVALEYYTDMPTATRYKVALEELSKGIWAAIAAGAAVVLAVVGKLIFWMLGRNKGGDGGGGGGGGSGGIASTGEPSKAQVQEAVKQAKAMPEQAKQMARSLDLGSKAIEKANGLLNHSAITMKNEHGKEFTAHSFEDVIKNALTNVERFHRAKEFFDTTNGYAHDIINSGPYSKMMAGLSSRMSAVTAALNMKADALDSVVRRDLGSTSATDKGVNTSVLATAAKPIEVTLEGRTMTLAEMARFLSERRHELMDKTVSKPIMFDKLFMTMADAYKSHTIDTVLNEAGVLLETITTIRERAGKLRDVARDLSSDGVPGALTEDVGENVRATINDMNQEIVALTRISSEIVQYFSTLEKAADKALVFGIEVVKKVAHALREQKKPVPEGWDDVLEELNQQHQAISKGYSALKRPK
jgi:hypothetical protein